LKDKIVVLKHVSGIEIELEQDDGQKEDQHEPDDANFYRHDEAFPTFLSHQGLPNAQFRVNTRLAR
jgi:hypothetical protein